jgi:hypothetical protein
MAKPLLSPMPARLASRLLSPIEAYLVKHLHRLLPACLAHHLPRLVSGLVHSLRYQVTLPTFRPLQLPAYLARRLPHLALPLARRAPGNVYLEVCLSKIAATTCRQKIPASLICPKWKITFPLHPRRDIPILLLLKQPRWAYSVALLNPHPSPNGLMILLLTLLSLRKHPFENGPHPILPKSSCSSSSSSSPLTGHGVRDHIY